MKTLKLIKIFLINVWIYDPFIAISSTQCDLFIDKKYTLL